MTDSTNERGSEMSVDLGQMRKLARLSQVELAERLGLSQATLSRYESNPGELGKLPVEKLIEWVLALGGDPLHIIQEISTAKTGESPGLEVGDPYLDLRRRGRLLKEFVTEISANFSGLDESLYLVNSAKLLADQYCQKPSVFFKGAFDSGKTTMVNTLLGGRFLPESYQPTTHVFTLVRHVDDRPTTMSEDVILLKALPGYEDLDDPLELSKVAIKRGDLALLQELREAQSAVSDTEVKMAMVFLDRPILKACNLVDLPGFAHDKSDTRLAVSRAIPLDVLVYASPLYSFMRADDLMRIRQDIRRFLPGEDPADSERNRKDIRRILPEWNRIFLVATHAAGRSEEEVSSVLSIAADRLRLLLSDSGPEPISAQQLDDLAQRFFTFYREIPARRARFEAELVKTLGTLLPKHRADTLLKRAESLQKAADDHLTSTIESYEAMIEDIDAARAEYDSLTGDEDARQERIAKKADRVRSEIERHRTQSGENVHFAYGGITDPAYLETLIKQRFKKDKRSAKELAAGLVLEKLQDAIMSDLILRSKSLKPTIKDLLGEYEDPDVRFRHKKRRVNIPFNSEGAFIGGIAGGTAVGALAVWAGSLGNLGAYIIAAKTVSVLSALGISIAGGTAAATAFLSAIGGPVTVAAGLLVLATLSGMRFFGESWERRMAKGLKKAMDKEEIKSKWVSEVDRYWVDTRKAFDSGVRGLENEWNEYLERIRRIVEEEPNLSETREHLTRLTELRQRFIGIDTTPLASHSGGGKQ